MPVGQLLMPLLGAAFGDQAPIQDPSAFDENGRLIPGRNPYKPSNFATRWLHPDVASQTGQLNNLAFQEQLANASKLRVAAENVRKARPGFDFGVWVEV